MKRVLLINQGKSENLGDKAINNILKEILVAKNCEVTTAGFSQTFEQNLYNMQHKENLAIKKTLKNKLPKILIWFLKYKKKIEKEFDENTIGKEFDLVIIGGGQLIKSNSVFMYALMTWLKLLKKKYDCPVFLLGVGVDKKYSSFETFTYKRILKNVKQIFVRDSESQKIIQKSFDLTAEYIPDVVFSYSNYLPQEVSREKNKLLCMIFSYNSYVNNYNLSITIEDYYRSWLDIIENNLNENLELVLGYTTIGDKMETFKFFEYLKKNTNFNVSIENTDDLEKYLKVLTNTHTLISGRMHGMLLGMNYSCKVIPYVVSPKIDVFDKEYIKSKNDVKELSSQIDLKINEILTSVTH